MGCEQCQALGRWLRGTGGVYIVNVETRGEAQDFIDADPFTAAGLFERVSITRWRKAYLDDKSYL